jgi:regulator of RNase E activity RraA
MIILGRAMTVLEADCFSSRIHVEDSDRDFGLMFEALDDLKAGEVYLSTGGSPRYALWGELMSTRAEILGAAGAVVDGYSRDTHGILRMGFPTFSRGTYAQDQRLRGRVIDYRCPLEFENGTKVHDGDLIFGDRDGVLVIPREIEAEILEAAHSKVRGENKVRDAILEGMSAQEAWNTFGIM